MLRAILLSLTLFCVSAFADYTAIVEATSLNVREEPHEKSTIKEKFNKGDTVYVFDCMNGFCKVSLPEDFGFVSERYLSKVEIAEDKIEYKEMLTDLDIDSAYWRVFVISFLLFFVGISFIGYSTRRVILGVVGSVLSLAILLAIADLGMDGLVGTIQALIGKIKIALFVIAIVAVIIGVCTSKSSDDEGFWVIFIPKK